MSDERKPNPGAPKVGSIPGAGFFPNAGLKLVTLRTSGAGGRVLRVHKERVVLGSVVSADARFNAAGVSPIHAVIELLENSDTDTIKAVIYDLASEAGTRVNGERVITRELRDGDVIGLGELVQVTFGLEDVREAVEKANRAQVAEVGGRRLFRDADEDLKPLLLEDGAQVDEIFDWRPAMTLQALEVVMSWRGTILDVEHFVREKQVTVGGGRRSDFAIPPLLGSRDYAIVTRDGEGFTLNLDPQMAGVIQRQGRLETLEQARAKLPGGGPQRVALGRNDFAKVSVGEVDFYLSHTAAPPRLKRRRVIGRDAFFMRVIGTSLVATALLIGTMLRIEVPQLLEAEEIPERLATVLYQPEKYTSHVRQEPPAPVAKVEPKPEPPKPKAEPKEVKLEIKPNPANLNKPVPKEMQIADAKLADRNRAAKQAAASRAQGEAKEGRGARAKGAEGTRGKPNAPKDAEPQNAASRPSAQAGKGRGQGNSQVEDLGNVDFLKGAGEKVQNLLAGTSANLGKGGSKLQGFGAFTTEGGGGLALSGDGKGGGGTAEGLGGLSDRGRGGGRVGTGLGASGNGSGIIGGKARTVIRTGGAEEAIVMGSIDAGAVEAALLAHRDEFRLCYEREVNAGKPKLAGRIGTTFSIGSSGRVTQAGISQTSLKDANTERCVLDVIRRIDFPIPRGAGMVTISYPFKFAPTGVR